MNNNRGLKVPRRQYARNCLLVKDSSSNEAGQLGAGIPGYLTTPRKVYMSICRFIWVDAG